MADQIKIGPIKGAAELAQFFAIAHEEAIKVAAKKGTQAAAARGKTLLARRAPKGLKSTTRIKKGWPRLSESFKSRGGKVTRDAGPVKGGSTVIAFVTDPDGYKIELIERKL